MALVKLVVVCFFFFPFVNARLVGIRPPPSWVEPVILH